MTSVVKEEFENEYAKEDLDSVPASIAKGMVNLLAIAAATEITFEEAKPVKALLAASRCAKDEEETTNEAKFDSSPPIKVCKEAENIERLTTCVNEINAKRSTGDSPYQPRSFSCDDFPGLGDRDVIFSAPVWPPYVNFKALGYGPRHLPQPAKHPIHGCSQDPAFYLCEAGENCRGAEFHDDNPGRFSHIKGHSYHRRPEYSNPNPFSTLPGFSTDCGVIQPPEVLFGWRYVSGTGNETRWVMSAC